MALPKTKRMKSVCVCFRFPLQREEEKYGQKAWPLVMGFATVQLNDCESFIYFDWVVTIN
jgi:hypothetical protein